MDWFFLANSVWQNCTKAFVKGFCLCIFATKFQDARLSSNLDAIKMNVILYIATIFNVGFCQNIYEPFDDQELGFLQEGRLHTLVSRIDNCEIQRNHEKRYLTEKFTTTENILKWGLEMISRLDYIIGLQNIYLYLSLINNVYGQTVIDLWVYLSWKSV